MVHPMIEALRTAHAALDTVLLPAGSDGLVGWVPLEAASPSELREAVRLQAELEGRVSGLRLHVVAAADAGDARQEVAAADTASWAASAGRNRARSWGGVALARLLDTKYAHVRAALATGRISEEHASVIVDAAEKVPDGVTAEQLAECEGRLVEKATRMAPRSLRRAARRLLEPLSTELADAHEDELLRDSERRARVETWFTLGDNGDGTWSGRFVIPELHGQLLKTRLEQLSSPRRYARTKAGEAVEDVTVGNGLNWTEAMGAAFLELVEHLPEHGHARSGVSVVVHVDEEKLRSQVGAATVGTGVQPGEDFGEGSGEGSGDGAGERSGVGAAVRISNQEVRRLLCEAAILPLVMGSRSVPLDLGMSSRLFTKAQWTALSAVHDTCAAQGCDRPFAWTELHHRVPWSEGGRTDLANAAPLCGHHHRRVHDQRYEHQWLPDGSVRFRHRWRSRWRDGADPWKHPSAA